MYARQRDNGCSELASCARTACFPQGKGVSVESLQRSEGTRRMAWFSNSDHKLMGAHKAC